MKFFASLRVALWWAFVLSFLGISANADALGPASKRTALVISEIMYHPADRADGKNLEYIEIYNSDGVSKNLSDFRIAGDVEYVFPSGTVIGAQSFLVIAGAPADLQTVTGVTALGPFLENKKLANEGGRLELWSKSGALLLEVEFSDDKPWPAAADGSGHSLVLARPTFGQNNPQAWAASALIGGSPRAQEPVVNDGFSALVLNEVLAHTDDPVEDYVEIYNHSNASINLAGVIITDDPDTNKFVIGNVSIEARGFVSFTQSQLGFALNAAGETVYLKNTAGTRVIDAVRFGGQENNVSWGRYPNGATEWYRMNSKTPGAPNLAILRSPVVINELMYSPISHEDEDQYVELRNASAVAVDLSGWELADGIGFAFPTNTTIGAGEYLVIAKDAARILANYTNLTVTNVLGNFSGRLAGSGERIVLTKPDTIIQTNNGVVTSVTIHIEVDEVTYGTGGRWPELADGGGSSLELIDPQSNHRLAASWAASDESRKAPWTLVEATGILDNGQTTPDQFQMHLQGAGEVLVDNVEVLDAGGVNQIANGTFESNATGWTAQGTQDKSGLDSSEGYNSTRSYRIRAVDRGDTGANRIRTPLAAALTVGQVGTIRAQVRWLRGHPEVLLRLRGNYLEAIGKLNVPKNLGTPGAVNSMASPFNSTPAIYNVMHTPILPAAAQGIVVTARTEWPAWATAPTMQVVWRIDNVAASGGTLSMNDSGTSGDAVAGDGIFSATIPGASSGQIIAFYVRATSSSAGTSLFPNNAPARECLVRVGETQPAGVIGTYRIWMTEATRALWASRGPLNNSPLDVTFVYNNERVIYNLKAMYAGSPYIAPGYSGPTSGLCGYTGEFPKDDLFLGLNDFVLDWPGRDPSGVAEQMSYLLADGMGLPNSHRRFIHLHVNGVNEQNRGSIYEDVQQPGGDMIKEWSAHDSEGHFYKIERWFEFSDTTGLIADPQPRLQNYTTTGGVKKLARYRWNWAPRAVQKSVNDFDDVFAWVDAANATAPEPYTSAMEALADMEEVMGMFAVERIISNFDSWGHQIGKNMYGYKPVDGRWITFMFDNDWLMVASGANYAPTSALFSPCEDPTVTRMYNHPPFRRAYWRNVKKAVDVLQATNINPVMDAKYQMLLGNGVTRSAGQNLTNPDGVKTWLAQRRDFLITQLNTVAANFEITSNGGANFQSPTSVATLTGTAPIDVVKIAVNGVAYPVTWTTETQWSLRVPLSGASTVLNLQGIDVSGSLIAGLTDSVTVTYLGTIESALGNVVFNEIMYHPTNSGGGFVELRSLATNTTFDLSNWRIEGVGFTFPQGTLLAPGGFAVVAGDRAGFTAAYGNSIPLAGVFPGQLRNDGETLWLVKPGATAAEDLVIDEVTYSDAAPWPVSADGLGASLQLIDARQDNNRALNWAAATNTPTSETPKSLLTITSNWKYNQTADLGTAWSATNYNDTAWPSGPGLLYVEGSFLPAPKSTALTIGRMTYYFRTKFNFTGDPSKVALSLSTVIDDGVVFYLNGKELHRIAVDDPLSYSKVSSRLVDNAVYEGPFLRPATNLLVGENFIAAEVHQNNSGSGDIVFGLALDSVPLTTPLSTPGTTNSVARDLPAFPPVWINELMPVNVTSISDELGQKDPWVEIYNAGAGSVNLSGWYLTDKMTNLTKWAFPAGTTLTNGQRLIVWLDGDGTGLHANFRAAAQSGTIALVFPFSGAPAVLDYINYSGVPNDRSIGRFPEGSGDVELFFNATPGVANDNSAPSLPLFINEWMASNQSIRDPSDLDFDDWFEIYNPNNVPVDLTGYMLTDNIADTRERYVIPSGFSIPAGKILLVWADEESLTNRVQLHVPFKLAQAGENIGLYAPNGMLVDSITFGVQTNNISQGRWPDGSASLKYFTKATPGASNVEANPNFRISAVTVDSASNVQISWTSEAGKTYLVQYKRNLNEAAWSDLDEVTASSGIAQVNDVVAAEGQRFYRILQVTP